MDRGAWWAICSMGKELDMAERLTLSLSQSVEQNILPIIVWLPVASCTSMFKLILMLNPYF